ncbi:MAG: aspartyl/asparaginyl beta-hydroxylase domain-containing protein [Pseudomonadota bacterium]
MIATDKFVFIHMHKTGGQSLNHIIERCIPGMQHIGYHYPANLLPEQYQQFPMIGIIRNPWDWYISWYAFNTRNPGNPVFFIVSDGFQASYQETLRNLINLGDDSTQSRHYRKALIDILPDTLDGNRGVGLTRDDLRQMNTDEGYFSWLFNRMHGNLANEQLKIGRFENLQQEFLSIMEDLQIEELEDLKSCFDKTPRMNSSSHSHYSRYFDDDLRDLVAQKDAALIAQYGYEFENDGSDKSTIEFPSIQIGHKKDGFRKLSGEAQNFLLLQPEVDLEFIKRKLARIPEKAWHGSGREQTYEVHKQTQSLLLIHDADFRHYNPTYHDLYKDFKKELQPIFDFISDRYKGDGYIVRALFARLAGNSGIDLHTDGLFSLLKCHRIHVPIITNDQVVFSIGGEDRVLGEGEMWEINNATLHAVRNNSNKDRIHLIVDWVPNATVRPEDKRPVKAQPAARSSATPGYKGRVVGRNEPCPCNSGKKFKHCHGAPR